MRQLVQVPKTATDKKQYGYLKKPLKQIVDTIVDELANLSEVAECYEVWNQIRDELNECYGSRTPRERLPLSQQKEFRKIKNMVIQEAESIRLGLPTFEDEKMRDEPEQEEPQNEHQSYSVYEQAQRYRAAKAVLQDIYALDEEHMDAVKELEQLWAEGYTVSAHQLGKFYQDDLSTLRNHEKAELWFQRSAEAGNDYSEYALGKLYLLGRGVKQDREQAKEWLTCSAAQGNEYAQFFLDRFDQFRDPSILLAATKLLHHMGRIFRDNSAPSRNPAGMCVDSKRRKRLMEKRMAMGHKADDHEEHT